ncbi:hypothetical protein SAMN05444422_101368 [Halobiforma haloterrestris]|uniref:Uncharacterized protein n=1 Tax=Natronobacterium haloterrestre TaxID=148448 RepID=A0A1I1D7T9_NATHA|nr:hypothetical protein [Halobiforma haloterrestris]SFB70874.1 hypothetical protein SAMN05444422_101368 [Halobiforma haloterrestris]
MSAAGGRRGLLTLGLGGVTIVALGLVLPWVGQPQVRVYVLGMESGLERRLVRLLSLCVVLGGAVATTSIVRFDRPDIGAATFAALGGLTLLVVAVTGPLTGRWPPDVGVYVTLVGGLVLLTLPAVSLVTA